VILYVELVIGLLGSRWWSTWRAIHAEVHADGNELRLRSMLRCAFSLAFFSVSCGDEQRNRSGKDGGKSGQPSAKRPSSTCQ
jgi:hypothetical protein